jgi:hypothetical protein
MLFDITCTIRTKSVYVCGIELKVTEEAAAPSVADAIGVYVAAIIIYPLIPYKAKEEY